MLRQIFTFLIVATTLVATTAQASLDAQYKRIIEDARLCGQATLQKDALQLRKYTHPNVVKATGGPEAFITVMQEAFKMMADQELTIDSFLIDLPASKIIEEQGEFRCLVPNKMVMRVGESKIISHSSLMGFSFDKGKSWCFVEAEKLKDEATRKQFFPLYKSDIFIPDDRMEMVED